MNCSFKESPLIFLSVQIAFHFFCGFYALVNPKTNLVKEVPLKGITTIHTWNQ